MFKEIPNLEGYMVNEIGQVKSPDQYCQFGHSKWLRKGRILKPYKDSKGYLRVDIRQKNYKVHRLVGLTFLDNPNKYDQINHINGIKSDNRVENLEWCNNSQNQLHAYRLGLNKSKKRNANISSLS